MNFDALRSSEGELRSVVLLDIKRPREDRTATGLVGGEECPDPR
jgi:hypothetical protein